MGDTAWEMEILQRADCAGVECQWVCISWWSDFLSGVGSWAGEPNDPGGLALGKAGAISHLWEHRGGAFG